MTKTALVLLLSTSLSGCIAAKAVGTAVDVTASVVETTVDVTTGAVDMMIPDGEETGTD